MRLIESIEGCADCAAEEAWKLRQGHECEPSGDRWSSFCEVTRDWRLESEERHRLTHEPERCEACQAILSDHRGYDVTEVVECASGQCTVWRCPYCKVEASSAGPVDCPSCGSLAGEGEG